MLLDNTVTSEGFFQRHHKEIRNCLSDVVLKNFTNIEEDEKRITFLENIPEIQAFNDGLKVLSEDPRNSTVCGKKDATKARCLKEEGNTSVQKGDWKLAMTFYTKSILFMPAQNDSELSVVFANRSAALYHLQEYEASLSDVQMALSLGYPQELRYKVLDRKARCYLALKWNMEAINAFKETISALDSAKLPSEKRHKMQTDAQVMIEILNKSFQLLNTKNKEINQVLQNGKGKKDIIILPLVSGKANKIYSAASEALTIERNETEGRFAQSVRDVSVGEIMVVEKAHCSVLLAEYAQTHCFHCFKRCINPLPCPTCSNITFCTVQCRTDALDTYHKYECPILRVIWDSGCSVTCHMALRILMQRPLLYFKDLKSKLDKPLNGKYLSDDYRCVYNLVGHEKERSKADLFQRTHMATFLLSLLKKTDYFSNNNNSNTTDKKLTNGKSDSFIGESQTLNGKNESSNDNKDSSNGKNESSNGKNESSNDNKDSSNGKNESSNYNKDSSNGKNESSNDNKDSSNGKNASSNGITDGSNDSIEKNNKSNDNKIEISNSKNEVIASSNEGKETDIESLAYIGSLILKNLQILQFNAHEIFELQCAKPVDNKTLLRKDQGKSVFLGGGLYPTLALFNHSCEPGVTRYFQGTSVIVQMVKNIKCGQQICENYGPLFTRKSYEERKGELSDQYWFQCHCIACEQRWPKFEDMDETIMRFKCDAGTACPNIIPVPINCSDFLVQCGLCQKHTNIMKGLKGLQDTVAAQKAGKLYMEKGEYGKALVKFIEELKLYDETLAPPFKDYHLCQQNIRRCLLTFGNVNIEK